MTQFHRHEEPETFPLWVLLLAIFCSFAAVGVALTWWTYTP
jgi:hypothetical protein